MPSLRDTIANRGKAPSAVRSAIRSDLLLARRKLYAATKIIDAILGMSDEGAMIERATRMLEAVKRLPDA